MKPSHPKNDSPSTDINIIANVSRIVIESIDRITGDRVAVPLMIAGATVHALKQHGLSSRIMYGQAAWIEVLPTHELQWAGCWGKDNFTFWVETENAETVDLIVGAAHRKGGALYTAPNLWSREFPIFYRYQPEGIAEIELHSERDQKLYQAVCEEIELKCNPEKIKTDLNLGIEQTFPNEPMICPDRKLLDDSKGTFKHFDRALSVLKIPQAPF
jgi:hypothetical protein